MTDGRRQPRELEDDPGPVPDELESERESYCAECGSRVHPATWTRIRHLEHDQRLESRLSALDSVTAELKLELVAASTGSAYWTSGPALYEIPTERLRVLSVRDSVLGTRGIRARYCSPACNNPYRARRGFSSRSNAGTSSRTRSSAGAGSFDHSERDQYRERESGPMLVLLRRGRARARYELVREIGGARSARAGGRVLRRLVLEFPLFEGGPLIAQQFRGSGGNRRVHPCSPYPSQHSRRRAS